jgi:hypothetical protein
VGCSGVVVLASSGGPSLRRESFLLFLRLKLAVIFSTARGVAEHVVGFIDEAYDALRIRSRISVRVVLLT